MRYRGAARKVPVETATRSRRRPLPPTTDARNATRPPRRAASVSSATTEHVP